MRMAPTPPPETEGEPNAHIAAGGERDGGAGRRGGAEAAIAAIGAAWRGAAVAAGAHGQDAEQAVAVLARILPGPIDGDGRRVGDRARAGAAAEIAGGAFGPTAIAAA